MRFDIDVAFFVEHKLCDKFMIVLYAKGWFIKTPELYQKLKWNNLLRKYNSKLFNLDGFAKQPWDIREKIIELMYNTTTL